MPTAVIAGVLELPLKSERAILERDVCDVVDGELDAEGSVAGDGEK